MVDGDKVIVCRECRRQFRFSQAEREYYEQKGFTEPSRCPDCRKARREVTQPVRRCSQCGTELAPPQPAYCNQCVENTRVKFELKLGALEKELVASRAGEGILQDAVRELERRVSEQEAESGSLEEQLKEVRLSNEELRAGLDEMRARELSLTQSMQQGEYRVGELAEELERARRNEAELRLRLELAQVSLENAKLAAEAEALRSVNETMAHLERRVCDLEERERCASQRPEYRGLIARLKRWVGRP